MRLGVAGAEITELACCTRPRAVAAARHLEPAPKNGIWGIVRVEEGVGGRGGGVVWPLSTRPENHFKSLSLLFLVSFPLPLLSLVLPSLAFSPFPSFVLFAFFAFGRILTQYPHISTHQTNTLYYRIYVVFQNPTTP